MMLHTLHGAIASQEHLALQVTTAPGRPPPRTTADLAAALAPPLSLIRSIQRRGEVEKFLGGDGTMKCVQHHPQPQCVQEGQTCGGPGLPDSTCCDGMQCERHFMGTHNLQCVVKEAQCVSSGQICGCAGCLTRTCCGGKQCSEVFGQGGKLFCVDS